MKALIFRLVGLSAALLITGLSFATTVYADNGGGPTHPPTPMSATNK